MGPRVLYLELTTPDLPGEPSLWKSSWFLAGTSSYFDLRGHCFIAPGVEKGPGLGLFEDLKPKDANHFQLELGVPLPDLFPNLGGQPEFCLRISNGVEERELCFSNVMARLRYVRDGEFLHALVPRVGIHKIREGKVDFIPPDASVELLRTFVAARFDIRGDTAEAAFETYCETCILDMIERLNRVLKALPFVDLTPGRVYSMAYSRATMPSFYFILKGESEDKLCNGWIAPHVGRTILNPVNLAEDQSDRLRRYLTGLDALDDIQSLLHSARSFIDGGVMEYVLLLSVIAAEVATQRFVHKRLIASEVSKAKLEAADKDMTYSLMLNVVLFALTPADKKPDKELIGIMNRGRSLRNAYMHGGALPTDHSEIIKIFESTIAYVNYLDSVERQGEPPSSAPR